MTTSFDPQGRVADLVTQDARQTKPGASLTGGQGADFTTFLKMLTTQMQNQNPLNPIEASDFAVQLATFSGVEQQVQTNQLLARLTERLLKDDMSMWLDTEVARAGALHVDDSPVSLSLPAAAPGVTRRDVVLRTDSGHIALRLPVDPKQDMVHLDPSHSGATPLLAGSYGATVEDFRGMDAPVIQDAFHFQTVREVRRDVSGILLVLASGQTLQAEDVHALRKP
ncbi:MAG: flagellar hook capping FlgD N-terminal domain-containing protein [Roseinatronobacter sp.]